MRIRSEGGDVRGTAWGPGAGWLLDRLPGFVGADDDPVALVTDHPTVSELIRRHPGVRFGSTGLVVDALVTAIVGQKVTGKEAARGLRGLHGRFSDPAPGPRPLRLPPDPERLAHSPYWEFHPIGIEKKRADTLRRIGGDAVRIGRLADVDPVVARRFLHSYRGVGVWTSAETVAVSHGHADAVSVGDYHHKHIVSWHLTGTARATDEEMLALLEPFRPHRGRVVRLLEQEGPEPSFGPHRPLRRIEHR